MPKSHGKHNNTSSARPMHQQRRIRMQDTIAIRRLLACILPPHRTPVPNHLALRVHRNGITPPANRPSVVLLIRRPGGRLGSGRATINNHLTVVCRLARRPVLGTGRRSRTTARVSSAKEAEPRKRREVKKRTRLPRRRCLCHRPRRRRRSTPRR